MKNINFFVYGSLREGFYNYNKFLAGKIENNQNEPCYVYFYNKDRDKLFDTEAIYIPNGDWKDYMLNNSII